ncbi:MAG: ECF-type sigma factor [Planctomycetota bacterium]
MESVPLSAASPSGSDDASPELRALFAQHHPKLMGYARNLMRRQPAGHTLQPTALVNEVFLRLSSYIGPFDDYGHFLRLAARTMRHVLIDHHRGKRATNRPGTCVDIELVSIAMPYEERAIDLAALDELLNDLAKEDSEAAQIVELRFFGGATLNEVADTLGLAARTVDRRWKAIKLLLHSRLSDA